MEKKKRSIKNSIEINLDYSSNVIPRSSASGLFIFTKDKNEWIGTKIIFEISNQGDKTLLQFTHLGLVPEYECYQICYDAWSGFIKKSLYNLLTTGFGQPIPKVDMNTIHSENNKKHNLEK